MCLVHPLLPEFFFVFLITAHVEMCQIISRSLDMSAQPFVSRGNGDPLVRIMIFAVMTSADRVLRSLTKRAASMNHVLNQCQMNCRVHFHNTFPQSVLLLFPALTPPHQRSSAKVKLKKTLNGHLSAKTSPNNNSEKWQCCHRCVI